MNTKRPPSTNRSIIHSPRHILLKPHQIIDISRNHRYFLTCLLPSRFTFEKKFRVIGYKACIITPLHEIRRIHNPPQISNITLHPRNLILKQHPSHPFNRILPTSRPHDQLTDHRIIKYGNLIPLIHITIHPHSDTIRFGNLLDNSRSR